MDGSCNYDFHMCIIIAGVHRQILVVSFLCTLPIPSGLPDQAVIQGHHHRGVQHFVKGHILPFVVGRVQ